MSNFEFSRLSIPDVVLIKPRVFTDSRGYFFETYKQGDFSEAGIKELFVQDNHSRSSSNVLRGLHYQKDPAAQGKLVRCMRGAIFDVAVDIRKGSPSYAKWVAMELNDENNFILYVPPGFAHGFVVLTETAELSYKCTSEYAPQYDRGIIWNDPDIAIDWPVGNPLLSDKDARHPLLKDADNNFVLQELSHRG